jgi:hypothetical protein
MSTQMESIYNVYHVTHGMKKLAYQGKLAFAFGIWNDIWKNNILNIYLMKTKEKRKKCFILSKTSFNANQTEKKFMIQRKLGTKKEARGT